MLCGYGMRVSYYVLRQEFEGEENEQEDEDENFLYSLLTKPETG
jgi:hypothetical protein